MGGVQHPTKPGHISVPHPKKDLGIGLVTKLLKTTGWPEMSRKE